MPGNLASGVWPRACDRCKGPLAVLKSWRPTLYLALRLEHFHYDFPYSVFLGWPWRDTGLFLFV